MTYQITLRDQDYAALAVTAPRSGREPEQFLHDRIERLQTSTPINLPFTTHELAQNQFHEGKISHVPTRQPVTPEEREARERRASRFAGGKPASEMVSEDRGPY